MRSLDDNVSDERPDVPAPMEPLEPHEAAPKPASAARGGVTPTPWTVRQMIIGAVATLVPWLAFSLGANALLSPSSTTTTTGPTSVLLDAFGGVVAFIVSALLEAVFLIAPLVVVFSRRLPHATFRERMRWLGFRSTPLLPAVTVIVVSLIIGLGGSVLYSQLIAYFHLPIQTNSEVLLEQGKAAPLTTLGLLAAAALAAPICEEVFFRGFIFTGILKRMPLWPSVALSAVIFGIAHADLGSLVPLVVIGLALAWARWRTDSIWPGIIVHALNNTAAALFLLPYLFK